VGKDFKCGLTGKVKGEGKNQRDGEGKGREGKGRVEPLLQICICVQIFTVWSNENWGKKNLKKGGGGNISMFNRSLHIPQKF